MLVESVISQSVPVVRPIGAQFAREPLYHAAHLALMLAQALLSPVRTTAPGALEVAFF